VPIAASAGQRQADLIHDSAAIAGNDSGQS
jgi:hypothetical protein